MKEFPLVSVIVTVYNLELYLGDCLLSLTGQTYGNLEILVVDDGSTDGSLAVAKRFAAADSRVRIISKDNEGLPLTRKRGVEESRGEYICWIDGDDYIHPNYIEKLVGAVLRSGCDSATGELMKVCGTTGCVLQSPGVDFLSPKEFAEGLLLDKVFAAAAGKLYKRELMEGLVWFPQITLWEDFLINIQVVLRRGYKGLCVVRDTYYYYIQRSGSMRRDRVKYEYIEDFLNCTERIFNAAERTSVMYLPERAVNMAYRHYVYVRILSNPWLGDKILSRAVCNGLRDNRKSVGNMMPRLVRWATSLYTHKSCFFIVKVLVTLNKWGNSFSKHYGSRSVKYSVPAAGEDKAPEVLKK